MTSSRPLVPRRVFAWSAIALVTAVVAWWLLRDGTPGEGAPSDPLALQALGVGNAPSRGGTDSKSAKSPPKTAALPDVTQPTAPASAAQNSKKPEQVASAPKTEPAPPAAAPTTRVQDPPSAPPNAPGDKSTPGAPSVPPSTITTNQPVKGSNVGVTTSADLARALQIQTSDPVQARLLATRALDGGTLSRGERERAYELIGALAKALFFNPNINPTDPTMGVYTVQSGDVLKNIVRTQKLDCEHMLLKRINAIADEHKIRIGQRLRVPKGAFNAEIIKSEYRLNLYLGEDSDRVMIASYSVGLGESNGTPLGLFKVRPNSKLVDPAWTHPRTGQHFTSSDPMNPIGEHWIGLIGVEDRNKEFVGYGIHGTIEPDSIGHDRSLGCVRMRADDVAIVFECLTEPNSTILIK